MARYRKIDPRIWKDEKFRVLSLEEKLIAFYVITAQSNRIGLFNFSPALAAEELGIFPQTFADGFRNVCLNLSWEYDEPSRTLYLPTWWKYNCPENPNVLKACLTDLHELPKTPLLARFSANLTYLPKTFHQTFREGLPKPSPHQEQEQEQEQEQKKERSRKNFSFLKNGESQESAQDTAAMRKRWLKQDEQRRIDQLNAEAQRYLR
jgi:hypothetical protein